MRKCVGVDAEKRMSKQLSYKFIKMKFKNLLFILFLFLENSNLIIAQRLNGGQEMRPGQSVYCSNRHYFMTYQTDGNFVVYRSRDNFALWSTKTYGQPAGRLTMQEDGNLVVYKPDGSAIWASVKNWGNPCRGQYLIMQDDGNAVVYDNRGNAVWASGTYREAINEDKEGWDCRRINGSNSIASRRTTFNPSIHGFQFYNDFVSEFAGIRFGGLCGGMCYSALDYFNNNIPIPTLNSTPANGTPLRTYIYNRQQNSTLDNIDKWGELGVNPFGWRTGEFFNWGLQGFNGGRLEELRAEIDAGRPAPLGLFKGGNGGFANHHQVLAIGYDLGRYTGNLGQYKEELKIFIYDPNFPLRIMTLVPNLSNATYYYLEDTRCSWLTYFVDKRYRVASPPR